MLDAAIVGLGRWGQNYVNSVQGASSRLRFTRGVVRNPEKSREFAEKHGLRLSTDYAELLTDPSIKIIVLATPNSQHPAQVVAAAQAGKAVMCEKPLALTRADAEYAALACQKAGVLLGVGQDKRFWPAMQELKRVVDSGVLGELLHIEGHFSNENASKSLHYGWRESAAESPGGSITATGIHVLDAFINLIGPLRRVCAQQILKSPPPETLDTLAITCEFANRVSGVLCGVRATPLFWRVHVFGNRGSAEAVGPDELIVRMSGGKVERRTFEPVNALRANLEAFADAIEGRAEYPIPTAQMIDVIAGLEAIVEAMGSNAATHVAV
ncbi:MAG: Gfo/Idh/MocA family oxidoreductase [Burkholderiales bacterium]